MFRKYDPAIRIEMKMYNSKCVFWNVKQAFKFPNALFEYFFTAPYKNFSYFIFFLT